MRPVLLIAILGALLPSAPAAAQTTFEWPERPIDFTRYTNPEQCMSLADRVVATGWRGEERSKRDTLTYNPLDTLPARVVTEVGRCVDSFDVHDAEPFELPWLFHLDLLANRDDQVRAVVARQTELAGTPVARAKAMLGTVKQLLDAQPVRLEMAREYTARLDSMGSQAAEQRMNVHLWLFWRYAMATLDTVLMRSEHEAYEAAVVDAGSPTAGFNLSGMMMREKVAAVLRPEAPDARAFFRKLPATRYPNIPTAKVEEIIDLLYGHGPLRVAGDFWFGEGAAAGSLHPTPGKVSFLVFVGAPCGGRCAGAYAVLRRLEERFGDRLDIVLMARTMGDFRLLPPPTPAEEAELIRQYFLEDVKLSDALGVVSTPFLRLPDPDGRYFEQGTPNLHYFNFSERDDTDNDAAWGTASGALIGYFTGPDGQVKARTTVDPKSDLVVNALAAKLIAATTAGAGTGSTIPASASGGGARPDSGSPRAQ